MEREADGNGTERGEEAEREMIGRERERTRERERGCGIEGVKGRSLRNASRALADNANKLDDNGAP